MHRIVLHFFIINKIKKNPLKKGIKEKNKHAIHGKPYSIDYAPSTYL